MPASVAITPTKNHRCLAYHDREGNPIPFAPLPYQRAIMDSRAYLRALVAGYGGGKTLMGCTDLLLSCLNHEGIRALDVSPSYGMANKTTIPIYEEILARSGVRYTPNKNDHSYKFPDSNAVLWIASGDNPDSLRGPNITRARIDEPFIQDIEVFRQVVARLRYEIIPCSLLLTGTPEQLNWGYDLLFGDPENKTGHDGLPLKRFSRAFLQISTLKNPYLPANYVNNLYESHDEQQVQAYVHGQFVSLNTLQAYYQWETAKLTGDYLYNPELPIYFTLDFNVEPFCADVIQQHGEVDWIVDELHIRTNANIPVMCQEFRRRYKDHQAGVIVTGDPAAQSRSVFSAVAGYSAFDTIRDELRGMPSLNISPLISAPPVGNRLEHVNARLKNARGDRRVFVDQRCKSTITDFERVRRTPDNQIEKDKDVTLTHHSDAIGYYLWQFRRSMKWSGA